MICPSVETPFGSHSTPPASHLEGFPFKAKVLYLDSLQQDGRAAAVIGVVCNFTADVNYELSLRDFTKDSHNFTTKYILYLNNT